MAASAVLTRRELPRVHGLLQELLRVVLPELAHMRVRVDDGVLQLAADALDLADVDVLRRVAVGVHLHRTAGRVGDPHPAQRGHERRAVLDVAADRLDRLADHAGARVAVLAVEARRARVRLLVGASESLVRRRVERGGVVMRADHAERLVAELRQDVLVAVGAVGDERLAPQRALRVLLGEQERPASQCVDEHRVGILAHLAEVRRIVLHVARHPDLLDHLPAVVLERLVEAAHRLPAERVVEPDHDDLLVAERLGRELPERVHVAAGGEAGTDEPLRPLALREVVGGVDRVEGRDPLRVAVRHERIGAVRQDAAGERVHLVVLDELARLGERGRRLAFVVLEDDLELPAARLPARLLPVQLAAAVHVLAGGGDGARQGRDEADLDRSLGGRLAGDERGERHGDEQESDAAHERLLSRYTLRRDPSSERCAPHIEDLHGDRSPVAESDDAGGQAVLGWPARAEADAAEVRRVRPRVLVPPRRVPEVPRAHHRVDPVEGARHPPCVRDRLPVVQQGVQGSDAVRAGDGRAGRGTAHAVEPHQRRGRSQEAHVRHAGGGRVLQADRRGHAAAVPAGGAVRAMANLRDLSNVACIVGVDESDEMGTLPHKSQLSLHVEAVTNAVRDAGLKVSDVDGIFTAGQHSPATIGEALGITARYVDGTTVGGCSFIIMVGHAVAALHHGLCDVAVISHGESGRSQVGVSPRRDTAIPGQYEAPYGFGPAPTMFGLITTRHMHQYGTTLEQWAQVAVSTRKWAALNPKALRREPITVDDVLKARPVVWPFTVLNICLVTDAGGAVVLTRADRARDLAKKPVYVRGFGEGTEHVSLTQMKDLTFSEATRIAGDKAFRMAGVGPSDFQHIMLYDAFTSGPPIMLESLGVAKRGEGVHFFAEGRSTPGGSLPINTNGGGLSYTHTGIYGIFPIIEATRQLRGECGPPQVPGVRTSLVNGMGGMLSAAGTLVLSNER